MYLYGIMLYSCLTSVGLDTFYLFLSICMCRQLNSCQKKKLFCNERSMRFNNEKHNEFKWKYVCNIWCFRDKCTI